MQIGTTHGAMLHALPDVDRAEQTEYRSRSERARRARKIRRRTHARFQERSTGILSAAGQIRRGEPVGQPGVSPGCCVSAGKMPARPTDKMSVLRQSSSEEMCAHNYRQGMKVEECEKI